MKTFTRLLLIKLTNYSKVTNVLSAPIVTINLQSIHVFVNPRFDLCPLKLKLFC